MLYKRPELGLRLLTATESLDEVGLRCDLHGLHDGVAQHSITLDRAQEPFDGGGRSSPITVDILHTKVDQVCPTFYPCLDVGLVRGL